MLFYMLVTVKVMLSMTLFETVVKNKTLLM